MLNQSVTNQATQAAQVTQASQVAIFLEKQNKLAGGLKYRWYAPTFDKQLVAELAARFTISTPIIQTLITRGYVTPDAIERFLFTSRERDVAHPSLLKDADKAVERILLAIERQEKILIAGDYDVDGITSSSVMLQCLLPLGAQVNFFLPNRARDGYGLSIKTVQRAAQNNYKVIITVDNGITAFEPVAEANKLGVDVIITDHHKPHAHVPEAYAIVNPHQEDCGYPFKYFAGVGVGFKLMSLLYERKNLPLPAHVYELLLLGTVADVVPLVDENRYWVRYGLHHIKKHISTALQVLKTNGRVTKPVLSAQDIGYFITPQINALGRLDDPRDGVKFLMSTDTQEVERIGTILVQLNEARKLVERSILNDIEKELKERAGEFESERVIIASSTEWPTGVIGLAASRLVANYHRPTFLFHLTSDGLAKGSCRSIAHFNVFKALEKVSDLLTSFGGHAAAAGLALPVKNLELFKERMSQVVTQELSPEDLVPSVRIDAELDLRDVSSKLTHDMAYLEPFGCDNAPPLFYIKHVGVIGEIQLLKEVHVKCLLFADGVKRSVIFFNRPDVHALLQSSIHESEGVLFDVVAQVTENHWNNEVRVELQGIDIRIAN